MLQELQFPAARDSLLLSLDVAKALLIIFVLGKTGVESLGRKNDQC